MLHACKYPSEPIWGLLLGTSKGSGGIQVTDVAPLFHSDLVASTLEAALLIVQEWITTQEGVSIVGCYVANRLAASNSVNSVTARFGHAIRKQSGGAGCIVVVDNSKMNDESSTALRLFGASKDGSWNLSSSGNISVEEGAQGALTSHLTKGTTVSDFDDHLDDPSVDFVGMLV